MRKIEYIRTFTYPRDNWRQVKVKQTEYPAIKAMRLRGYPVKEIAIKYRVSCQTIRMILKYGHNKAGGKSKKTLQRKREINNASAARRRFLLSMGLLIPKVKIITLPDTKGGTR